MPDSRRPRWLTVSAYGAVGAARLMLSLGTTPTALRLLAGGRLRRRGPVVDTRDAFDAVGRAARWWRAECLPQSVALAAVLQRTGRQPEVVIGCRLYGPGQWGAHAWVEVEGSTFDSLAQYEHKELCRLSAAERWRITGPGR